jgi:HK97 family phage portal protein
MKGCDLNTRSGDRKPSAARTTEGFGLSNPMAAAQFFVSPPGAKVPVTEVNALNLSAVWSAVRVISGSASVLPLCVYKKGAGDEREEATGIPGVALAANPNPEMTPVTFWESLLAHMLTWGNGYAEIERNGAGEPIGLWPILPNAINPRRDTVTGKLYYEGFVNGRAERLESRDVFHVPGLGFDGLRGYSPIAMARRSLTVTATAEQAGETFFAEGMRPGGVLEYPGSLQELQKLNLEEQNKQKHGGAPRFGKTLVLWGGMKYNPLSIPPDDAQFLETRQFQVVEIARWFNLPPHKIRDLTRATFSNIEHQGQEFVTETLLYWLTKIDQEFKRKILAESGEQYYAAHNLDALLRGDMISRFTAYGLGRQWSILTPNDCRRKENLPPKPGGDELHVPVNLAPLGSSPSSAPESMPSDPGDESTGRALATAVARELCERDASELEQMARGDAGLVAIWAARVGVEDWAWAREVVEVRCCALGHLLKRPIDAGAVAARYAARRVSQVRELAGAPAGAADAMAARWRGDVEDVRDLVLSGGR